MITVHHLENSRSQRVLWLLEELELEYELKSYARHPKTSLGPPELREIHPLGKSPIITDDEITVAESGAILEYLTTTYGKHLIPEAGTPEHRSYIYWLHYAEGSLMPPLLLKLIFSKVRSAPMPFFVKPIAKGIAKQVEKAFIHPQLSLHIGFVESQLEKTTWFAGDDFTAADVQMSFPLEAVIARGTAGKEYPNISEFVKRIHNRPAYQRAIEKGGTYQLMS